MTEPNRRAHLKIYLGYAAGVGKTFMMLDDAHKLKQQGVDVVIGYFEAHGRADTITKAQGLEVVPRRKILYRGAVFEEMDAQAVLARRPQVCLVDELAHTNVPGSERAKRWENVLALLDAGIHVWTTLNVQHLESLNDQVWEFSGVRVRETLPDWVVKQADEIVMVDLPPEALLNRLRRGAVYAPEKAEQALQNFFQESTLAALRELTLRQAAHEVDLRQAEQEQAEARPSTATATPTEPSLAVGEQPDRILIHVTADPATAALVRRGRRVADFLRTECFAVYISRDADLRGLPPAEGEAVERHLNFARNLRIATRHLQGEDVAATLVEFARLHRITQIFLLRPRRVGWPKIFGRTLVQKVVRLARDMQVTIVAERRRDSKQEQTRSRQRERLQSVQEPLVPHP
ncbi:MAG: histidine kinase [Acidobacteriia bacterium]|nr:histidine kinase [Terriglobia bacterium]